MTFCRALQHGLVYNNNTTEFTISPCCYFAKDYSIDPQKSVTEQFVKFQKIWQQENIQDTCKICIAAEASGMHSYRQSSLDLVPAGASGISMLTVAVNKQCNLACASCNSASSSFWFRDNIRNGVHQPQHIINLHKEDHRGEITKKFVDIFESDQFENLNFIKFGGGEPLMSSTHEEILSRIKNPERVTVQYTSNFSIMPTVRTTQLWEKFQVVKWCASIDGINDQFELLRWPYKWQDLLSFVNKAKLLVPSNVMFGVEHTINPLNIWYYDQFREWFDTHMATNRLGDVSDFNIHTCTGELGLEQTPPALRHALAEKFGNDHLMVQLLRNYPYTGSYNFMVNWLDSLDQRRKTNWRKTFAEVAEFYA